MSYPISCHCFHLQPVEFSKTPKVLLGVIKWKQLPEMGYLFSVKSQDLWNERVSRKSVEFFRAAILHFFSTYFYKHRTFQLPSRLFIDHPCIRLKLRQLFLYFFSENDLYLSCKSFFTLCFVRFVEDIPTFYLGLLFRLILSCSSRMICIGSQIP